MSHQLDKELSTGTIDKLKPISAIVSVVDRSEWSYLLWSTLGEMRRQYPCYAYRRQERRSQHICVLHEEVANEDDAWGKIASR